MSQQRFRPPDLFHDETMDVARWLANQEPEVAVLALAQALIKVRPSWTGGLILLFFVCFAVFSMARMSLMSAIAGIFVLAFLKVTTEETKVQHRRRHWLRQQLITHLERGGRSIPLAAWIEAIQALGSDRRKAYDAFARRLATATMEELQALTQEERAWLREPLKEWPGEALQTAHLLALGTAGDIFAKPYARRLVRNPDESETVREAAEECLRSLERTG